MCGRYTLATTPEALADAFVLAEVSAFPRRYNIAPTQPVATIVQDGKTRRRKFRLMRWGLIPSWAKDPAIGNNLINARAETVQEKPSFRSAFKYRRCLIPADGFYEWQKLKGSAKQPYYFHLNDGKIFAFAGLWESWNDIETCTILTTTANDLLQPIHERMPVMIAPQFYDTWLSSNIQNASPLLPLLNPFPSDPMAAYPVGTWVNAASHDDPRCIEMLTPDI
jgi:putative SOS response-associated peptidase YedK